MRLMCDYNFIMKYRKIVYIFKFQQRFYSRHEDNVKTYCKPVQIYDKDEHVLNDFVYWFVELKTTGVAKNCKTM